MGVCGLQRLHARDEASRHCTSGQSAKWQNMKCELRVFNWDILQDGSVDDSVERFMDILDMICRKYIPNTEAPAHRNQSDTSMDERSMQYCHRAEMPVARHTSFRVGCEGMRRSDCRRTSKICSRSSCQDCGASEMQQEMVAPKPAATAKESKTLIHSTTS